MVRSVFHKIVGFLPPSVVRSVARARARYPWVKYCLAWLPYILHNREGVIRHGAAKGLRFNSGKSNVGYLLGSADQDLQSIFEMLINPGMVVYDVGANVGFFTVLAAKLVSPMGSVVAFEPLSENFNLLRHNTQINNFTNVTVRDFAIGERDGTSIFLVSANSTFGALAEVASQTENQLGKTEVTVRSLDSLVQHECFPLPHVVKIDVEGAEGAVLDGAQNIINNARPILIIELHGTNAVIAEKLKTLGYFSVIPSSTITITEAHWNAQVIAFPAHCPELIQLQNANWADR